ncbi:MAG: hypothetical protein A2W80_13700 [Candidatus Riflebacteria bacterium GWC2_50_8]|nr:MAG: hypothetical protein A2W80_13700 [Candidatus Riflebacteria bacterium GWC2_50_8]
MSKTTASNKNQDYDTTAAAIAKRELRDEMWRVSTSLQTVSDLMIPNTDLNEVNREGLATLLNYLTERLNDLMTQTE